MNLSSLLSIVMDFIILIFFNNNSDKAGITNVVAKTMARHISSRIKANSHNPVAIKIKNIHVGKKIGCVTTDMN